LTRLAERVYSAAAVLLAGGWLAVVALLGPLTSPMPQVLGIGALVFAVPWWPIGAATEEPLGFLWITHEHAHRGTGVDQPLDDRAADPPGGADDGDSHEGSFRTSGSGVASCGGVAPKWPL
jgi:hypothetical protein